MVFCVLPPQRIVSEVGEGGSLLGGHSCRHCPRGAAVCSNDQCPTRPCRQGFVCCCCCLSQYKLLLEVARLVSLKKQITLCKWWQGRVLLSYRGWSKSLTRPGGASSLEKGTPWVTCMICPESGHPPGSKVVNRSPVTSLWEGERATCCAEQAPGRPVIPGQVPPSSQSEEASLQPTRTLVLFF